MLKHSGHVNWCNYSGWKKKEQTARSVVNLLGQQGQGASYSMHSRLPGLRKRSMLEVKCVYHPKWIVIWCHEINKESLGFQKELKRGLRTLVLGDSVWMWSVLRDWLCPYVWQWAVKSSDYRVLLVEIGFEGYSSVLLPGVAGMWQATLQGSVVMDGDPTMQHHISLNYEQTKSLFS